MKILIIEKKVKLWKPALIIIGSFVGLVVANLGLGYLGAGWELTVPAAWAYMIIMGAVVVDYVRKSQLKIIETTLEEKACREWIWYGGTTSMSAPETRKIMNAHRERAAAEKAAWVKAPLAPVDTEEPREQRAALI